MLLQGFSKVPYGFPGKEQLILMKQSQEAQSEILIFYCFHNVFNRFSETVPFRERFLELFLSQGAENQGILNVF